MVLGYNPIGESAPGLPRHDAGLPGHVPGAQFPPIGGGESTAPSGWTGGSHDTRSVNTSVGAGGSTAFALWPARAITLFAIYLTLPLQLGLYPIAGAPALAAGWFILQSPVAILPEYNTPLGWAWTGAFLVLLSLMRIETAFEESNPAYRNVRHWLRVSLVAGAMYYSDIGDGDPQWMIATIATVTAALAHFILRAALLRAMWDGMQTITWLRKA